MVKKKTKKVARKAAKKARLSIKKRNGKLEDFSKKKVKEALKFAGAAAKDANEIADQLAVHAKKKAKKGIVTAVEIERSVVSFLVKKNKEMTENFKKAARKW
jgi:hypothetical protein